MKRIYFLLILLAAVLAGASYLAYADSTVYGTSSASTDLTAPGPIGGTTPSTGAFTEVTGNTSAWNTVTTKNLWSSNASIGGITGNVGTWGTVNATNLWSTVATLRHINGTTGSWTTINTNNLWSTLATIGTLTVTNIIPAGGAAINSFAGWNTSGTFAAYSSYDRTVTDWRTEVSALAGTGSQNGTVLFTVPYAIQNFSVFHATDAAGTVVIDLDWKYCGTTSWATCTSMLSAAVTCSGSTPTTAAMGWTSMPAGGKVKLTWGTMTGTGALVTYATGTASGVQ